MKVIGYVRVSTTEQAEQGLSLDTQRAAILAECARRGWEVVDVITDDGYSATNENRPGFQRLLQIMDRRRSAARPDAVVVARLDRLTRSMPSLVGFINKANARRFGVVAIDMDLNTRTANGKMVMQIVGVVAEWESAMISERVSVGMRAAHAKRRAEGRSLGFPTLVDEPTQRRILRARRRGDSYAAIARALDAAKIPTPGAGQRWNRTTVLRICKRADRDNLTTSKES